MSRQESFHVTATHAGECLAASDGRVLAIGSEFVECQSVTTKAPNFRNTKNRIDTHAIERTRGDVNLNNQIRRWIDAKVEFLLSTNCGFVGDPVTFIRFQATLFALAAKRHGAESGDRNRQFICKSLDQPAN